MWCYAEQLSHPNVFVPCCVIVTSSTIFLEKLVGHESSFHGVPQLEPLFILSLKNIQQIVIGPCYGYLRLEEAFVGNSGTFSLYGLEPQGVRRLVNNLVSLCRKSSPANEFEWVDLNMHSEILKEIISREEKMPGLASDRLVLMIPIQMLESSNHNFLILSENQIYCVGINCSQWPPPSFQTSPENQCLNLELLHEFSIMNRIVDMKIHPSCKSFHHQEESDSHLDFNKFQLSIYVSVSEKDWIANVSDPQQSNCYCHNYLFPSSSYRDFFLDRLSNLRAEHENRMCPSIREEPEGGNEQESPPKCQNYHQLKVKQLSTESDNDSQLKPNSDSYEIVSVPTSGSDNCSESNVSFKSVLTDTDVYKEVVEYEGPVHSSSPKEDLSISPMSNFSRASISPPQTSKPANETESVQPANNQNTWHNEQTVAKAGSLPSSFDWKNFYFKSPTDRPDTINEYSPQTSYVDASRNPGLNRSSSSGGFTTSQINSDTDKSFENKLFLDLKTAITQSGGDEVIGKKSAALMNDVSSRSTSCVPAVESEHDLFLKQCVKSYDLIDPLPIKLKPLCLMNGVELRKFFYNTIAQNSNQEGLHEELHYVLWGCVIPYTNPRQEITTLIMLSTYAVYFVSDVEVKVAQTSRPSWMSHSRNQSDSAIAWKTQKNPLNSPNKKQVKSYAILKYKELHQVNIGLFDQCVRLTGSNENCVFTIAARDRHVTEQFVQKMKQVLCLVVSSPMVDLSVQDLEQDFYQVKSEASKNTLEGLVYTHPSKVNFVYPGDEAVNDMLYLIKERTASATAPSSQNASLFSLWFYMQCYILPSDDNVSTSMRQARSVIITPLYFSLAEEDIVTYPLPDFVRGLPENPCHEILECRPIDSLKSIQLYQANPHWLCLVFADEKLDIVVDVSMQHFGQPLVERERQKPGPEVRFKLFIQSLKERDKLVEVLEKLWKQQVSVVGRILDVHKV